MRKKIKKEEDSSLEDEIFPLPIYKAEDDIYNREEKESLEDEDNSIQKELGYKDLDPVIRELLVFTDHQVGAEQGINDRERSRHNDRNSRKEQYQRADEHPEFTAAEFFFFNDVRDLFIPRNE